MAERSLDLNLRNGKVSGALFLLTSTGVVYASGSIYGTAVQIAVLHMCMTGAVLMATKVIMQRQRRYSREMSTSSAKLRNIGKELNVLGKSTQRVLAAVERTSRELSAVHVDQRDLKTCVHDLQQLVTTNAVLFDLLSSEPNRARPVTDDPRREQVGG